jgi:hypothetical protein
MSRTVHRGLSVTLWRCAGCSLDQVQTFGRRVRFFPQRKSAVVREDGEMKKISILVYGIYGAVAVVFGVTALLFPTVLSSEAGRSFHLMHTLREQGATTIFMGLMSFWCIFNYDQRRIVHYWLTIIAFLLAGIHWIDYFGGHLPWLSPLYNSVPFAVLLAMAVMSQRHEKA